MSYLDAQNAPEHAKICFLNCDSACVLFFVSFVSFSINSDAGDAWLPVICIAMTPSGKLESPGLEPEKQAAMDFLVLSLLLQWTFGVSWKRCSKLGCFFSWNPMIELKSILIFYRNLRTYVKNLAGCVVV